MNWLIIRLVLYAMAGAATVVATLYPGVVSYDEATKILTINLGEASELLGLAIGALIGGGTFAWSRVVKRNGGMT